MASLAYGAGTNAAGTALLPLHMAARGLLIAYALINTLLYSTLLPLWEGFDEPFHFGYVQQLASAGGFPDARTARLSGEVGASLLLAPASAATKQNLPQVVSFDQFFAWPESGRQEARKQLDQIPPDLRRQSSQFLNYEAQHPPLAYLLLAVPERILARIPLPPRVAILRIIAAGAGALLLLAAAERLFSQLGLPEPYRTAALFCMLSSQMLWATLAHIGNDWLAVPLAVWTLVALNLDALNRTGFRAALYLAAGLLTKAYFLCLIPLLIGIYALQRRWRDFMIASAILCGIAGPWYARNFFLYGDFTGMQEGRAGIGVRAVARSITLPHWPAVIAFTARTSIWTGNNSFRTFSSGTLNLMLGACLLALVLWAASRHTRTEWVTCGYCALFLSAMGYYAVASSIHTHGASKGPEPWYAQVLPAPLLGLTMLGTSRFGTSGWRRIGPFTAALLVMVSGYILAATYFVKLIPLYGGYEARTSLAAVAGLYIRQTGTVSSNLNTVTMAPAAVIFLLSGAIVVLVVMQQIALIGRLLSSR